MLASARRFNGGIQCQQVGLIGDIADHVQDGADLLTLQLQRLDLPSHTVYLCRQLLDAAGGVIHHMLTALNGMTGLFNRAGCHLGAVGDRVRGGGHLVNRGGNLLNFLQLQLSTTQRLLAADRAIACRLLQGQGGAGYIGDNAVDVADQLVNFPRQFTGFIFTANIQPLSEIAARGGQTPQHRHHLVERLGNGARGPSDPQHSEQGERQADKQLDPNGLAELIGNGALGGGGFG